MEVAENIELEIVKLQTKPIRGSLAKDIVSAISANKIFMTRVENLELESQIISTSAPLFTYSPIGDIKNKKSSSKKFIGIELGAINKHSNITQVGNDYVASKDGIFIIENDIPRIIPISLDGSCDVRISDDKMFIYVDIYPSLGDNPINTKEDIVNKILQMEVKAEIKKNLLIAKLQEVENEKKIFLDICIVEGKKPIDGKDGRFENCTSKKEVIKDLTSNDFYKVNPAISVKENEVIAILHPPTNGKSGMDVFGSVINPAPGKPTTLKLGKHTSFTNEEEKYIVTKKDGFINISDSSISITDTFTVRGNIDFDSGNIIGKGSLKVIGNVLNDFTLNLSKDIEIGGYVGDANIEAGEKITVRGGFLGKGKGVMKSNGNIELKFVENQTVYSRDSIFLNKDTLNAKLFAKEQIVSKSKRSAIVGGHIIAGEFIEVYSAGNNIGTKTVLEVGFDYLKRNYIAENKQKHLQLRAKLEEVDKNIFEFAKMKRRNTEAHKKLEKLAELHKKLVVALEVINDQNIKTNSEIYVPTSTKISISGPIYSGVIIGINGRFMKITNPLRAKTFLLSEDNEVIAV
ncbi:MAG: FapA family protein [Melioribacteraceae bacterium]